MSDKKDKYADNQELREKIIRGLTEDENGNFKLPFDKDTLQMVDKFMTSKDKVEMHKDRLQSDNENADANRQVAIAIANNTSTMSMQTRNTGEATGNGPRPLGNDRDPRINPATIEPVGGDIDIDQITRDGRRATKGQDPDSEE